MADIGIKTMNLFTFVGHQNNPNLKGATKWATKKTKITIKVTGNVTRYQKERKREIYLALDT